MIASFVRKENMIGRSLPFRHGVKIFTENREEPKPFSRTWPNRFFRQSSEPSLNLLFSFALRTRGTKLVESQG